jgi:DDB1- and CUL4-associated factor 13
MEAFNFAAGNEDHNIYLYDMRKLSRSLNVYKDHVAAVLDVDFSPTGQELVSGSYDRTIRIYRAREGHSREIYHTKRMQRVFCVKFSMDSKYIVSGSDDGNVRLWRSNASERAGVKSVKQRTQLEYDDALKERFKHMPEIRRISRHRHIPQPVKKAGEIKRIELNSIKQRTENLRRHSKKGAVPYQSEREKHIIGVAFKDDEKRPKKESKLADEIDETE